MWFMYSGQLCTSVCTLKLIMVKEATFVIVIDEEFYKHLS